MLVEIPKSPDGRRPGAFDRCRGVSNLGGFQLKKLVLFAATAAVASLLSATFADATTYVASRTVGNGSVDLSITTDGTLGVLSGGNITDWTIKLTQGAGSFTLFGPLSGSNSTNLINGSAFSATATQLLFDYGAELNSFALFQAPNVGSGQTFWCVQTNGCFDFAGPAEGLLTTTSFGDKTSSGYEGVQVIASAGGVPEPATWALMITGFGMAGSALRRRRTAVAA